MLHGLSCFYLFKETVVLFIAWFRPLKDQRLDKSIKCYVKGKSDHNQYFYSNAHACDI